LVVAPHHVFFMLATLVASAAMSRADDVLLQADVDATKIGAEDQVRLTITLEGRAADSVQQVALPPLKNLRHVGGPFLSTQVSFVNGAVSQSRSFTYVLQPIGPGKAEIGALQLKVGTSDKTTAPIEIEVVPGSLGPRQSQPRNPFDDGFGEDPFAMLFGNRRRRAEPKLQVAAVASRMRVHVGEPVLLTFFLYTQTSVAGVQLAAAPQYAGFWAEDLEQPKTEPRGERATFDGDTYARYPILRKLLFPTRAGGLTIPAATFRFGLPQASLFDSGPNSVDRSTKPLTITVDPLPTEAGFSGAVGEYQVSATLDRDSLPLGAAATLRFTVKGTGNLKWVDRGPELTIPGAKVYPPQTKSDLKVGPEGIKGSKSWEFVVVPETSGSLAVAPLTFAYFDPSGRAVKRAMTPALALNVEAGAAGAAGPATSFSGAAPQAARLVLRSDLDLPSRPGWIPGARAVGLGLGLALALHGAIAAGSWLSDRRRSATGRSAARRTVRGAIADLQRARRGRLGKEEAAALIERTLHGVFGSVEDGGGPPAGERERAIRDLLQQVQFIRYAPQLGDYSEKIAEVAGRAEDVVRKWA